MKWKFGFRQILVIALVVALGGAVYLNYYANRSPSVQTATETTASPEKSLGESVFVNGETTTTKNYFESARDNRSNARAEALEIVQDILQSGKASEAERGAALETAATAAAAIEQESKIEDILRAKGFSDAVVYIEGDSAHVIVPADALADNQTLQIMQVVTSQSQVKAENVNIVAAK